KRWIFLLTGTAVLLFVRRRTRREIERDRERQRRSRTRAEEAKAQRASTGGPRPQQRVATGGNRTAAAVQADAGILAAPPPPPQRGLLTGKSTSNLYSGHGQKRIDIGAVLGMDIGGTLAKLVYFEKKAAPALPHKPPNDPMERKVALKRSQSLGNLSDTKETAEALREFYTFMSAAESYGTTGVRDEHLTYYSHALGGQLHFFRFETRHMDHAIELISKTTIHHSIRALGCTGGGAFKFEDFFNARLGVKMLPMDEMASLVRGLQFCLANVANECYTYKPTPPQPSPGGGAGGTPRGSAAGAQSTGQAAAAAAAATSAAAGTEGIDGGGAASVDPQDTFRNMRMRKLSMMREKVEYSHKVVRSNEELLTSYPALVVSIGSGVSILKVDGPMKFERVSGSSIGGGTYWGLCRLLTGTSKYDESLDLAAQGNSDLVDMLVGDIYGRGYSKFQLSSNTLASSFGKVASREDPRDDVEDKDLCKALVVMITMNIGQVAYLNAKLYDTRRIYFVGNFLRHNKISARRLSFAIDYWSGGEMEALFFEHEGYFGALGAFLMSGVDE
ncbi:unnamed protein product, partial [Phaeothamnion confervicola]